jgi:hypothetical protein
MPPISLSLGEFILAQMPRKARSYRSEFTLVLPDGTAQRQTLEVNRAVRHGSWWIYQRAYDTGAGPGAAVSILEAVRDPWLPGVQVGLALLALGSVCSLVRAGSLLRSAAKEEIS